MLRKLSIKTFIARSYLTFSVRFCASRVDVNMSRHAQPAQTKKTTAQVNELSNQIDILSTPKEHPPIQQLPVYQMWTFKTHCSTMQRQVFCLLQVGPQCAHMLTNISNKCLNISELLKQYISVLKRTYTRTTFYGAGI